MDTLVLLGEILMVNLVLSGDNAVVIAMASKNLPVHQRKKAVWLGAMGAVILRLILTWIAVVLLKVPYIQAAGGILLLIIAFKLLLEHSAESKVQGASTLWKAVQTILAADFIMSLDNVLAIAALANGDVAILVIGIVLSIPIVVWGSNIIANWLQRFPFLVYAGAGILGLTAGKMMLHDPKLGPFIQDCIQGWAIWLPWIFAGLIMLIGMLKKRNEIYS
ncbi:YjbE family integral membrane protein [Paenibacillus shirakamiensis]|uniref:YjbE family integral membrane protein n=1 Tax=Paenibacillus shirakamiensis TaxID=1265935 RepID=A0ABS4JBV1_9BACL|nr:YjbE family integral membrane protein [Paenibacillus shirakamiensis]